ncbi:pyruvate dehydrogenase phosphatase, partial [Tremellales sp. Uapishka_1]
SLPYPPPSMFALLSTGDDCGACALTAVLDIKDDTLHVANLGDARAVAGWWNPSTSTWRCDTLTQDMMGDNPAEVARVQAEHPGEDTAIHSGRLLGYCQPTRAFGDAELYRVNGEQRFYNEVFQTRVRPTVDGKSLTPPYGSDTPEVTFRKLHPDNGEELKFLIVATDGLWDRLSSEEATLLMAGYLAHPAHSDIPKTDMPKLFQLQPESDERPWPAEASPGMADKASGSWVFEGDTNACTHLIRNSLGGDDRELRRERLSLQGEAGRPARDDITAVVVFFDENKEKERSSG